MHNLSLRFATVLIAGFVLLQLAVTLAMLLPSQVYDRQDANLPPPDQVRAMAFTLETIDPGLRAAALANFDDSLFQVRLTDQLPPVEREKAGHLSSQRRAYLAALADRPVLLWRDDAIIHRPLGDRPGPQNFIDPTRLAVGLRDGRWLLIDSRPSVVVQHYMRSRAYVGMVLGSFVLLALAIAVRQTTRPLVRLSRRIRTFAAELDAPDLPLEGAQELRDLSAAFNDMKGRIRGLVAERTQLLAAVAHDMRTYLTRLRLRTEFIEDPEHRRRAINDIGEMHDLLEDTLLFAQREAASAPNRQRVDLAEELTRMVGIRTEIGESVVLGLEGGPLIVDSDPVALRRIVANLVDNGLRHGDCVRIDVAGVGSSIRMTIEDDGPGVPDDALSRLGRPFERLDPSRDRETGGAGLGLAIVLALAERNGIEVGFENAEAGGLRIMLVIARSFSQP
ncbi:ATP-binding protein [Novosphingobium sp. CECT 9465]|uniref:ATP-binding protein n=1 Tax=Novosphingobium sp. CECT 9465 TaxID=2829794 RepID=UPI001E3FB9B3|nr:ATP-binding protein [Novosphingobium sp. CECT 9465]CAH0495227.1 Sensor histidine kinase RcsC [Novosphingobium sp. CECT 9465]